MKSIASKTGGLYFRATDNKKLKEIYDEINKLEKTEVEEFKYSNAKEIYRIFVLISISLILIEWILDRQFLKVLFNVSIRRDIIFLYSTHNSNNDNRFFVIKNMEKKYSKKIYF